MTMFSTASTNKRCRGGFTIIELLVSIAAALMIALIVGILFQSGQRSWLNTFSAANSQIEIDALQTITTLGAMGRKSNRTDYKLYTIAAGRFYPVVPVNPEEVVVGQAVEFHYWDIELDDSLMDTSKKSTAYVLMYLEGNKLKADYGPCPPGGVNASGIRIVSDAVDTVVLAENVVSIEFSHTTKNLAGDGKGCVRMKMILNDTTDGSTTTVTGATLMRNIWP